MDKRYQVFVSSTYRDLEHERIEVMKALLELDCIPCGMEYFPAADETQWSYIQRLIDHCDYYVVIVGGRYGSLAPDGFSYTQKEYEYAVGKGIPTLAFIHKNPDELPSKHCEDDPEKQRKLDQFIDLVKTQLCKEWKNADHLAGVVTRSLNQLIKTRPRVGWVRADVLPDETTSQQLVKMMAQVSQLQTELAVAKKSYSKEIGSLAKDSDVVLLTYKYSITNEALRWGNPERTKRYSASMGVSWDEIFSKLAPNLITEGTESIIKSTLNRLISERTKEVHEKKHKRRISSLLVSEDSLQTVKVQFIALGLIEIAKQQYGENLVRLTPAGEAKLYVLRAVRKTSGLPE